MNNLLMESHLLCQEAVFVEIQVHDRLRNQKLMVQVSGSFKGHVTMHGEGETEGKKRIMFCSEDESERKEYVRSSASLYASVIDMLWPKRVRRIILHPSKLSRKQNRNEKLQVLARSLGELKDLLPKSTDLCIEPRGGSRQGRVLRLDLHDLTHFQDSLGTNRTVGLCIDVAQLFVTHGNHMIGGFLKGIKEIGLSVSELHVSDVFCAGRVRNKVAMEIGKGQIDWNLIVPDLKATCNDWLIETLGGIPVFKKSKVFLEKTVNQI